jgi:MFS family permease
MSHPELLDDGPPVGKDLALATWGLFVGLAFLLFVAGLIGTLLGVRTELEGLPTLAIGVISASYYCGFLVGSKLALSALLRVGHIRAFSALASLLAAAVLGIGLTDSPWMWGGLRLATGLCLAGQYVVAESWLNDLADNETRGRILGIYNIVTIAAFGAGQVSQFLFDPRVITGFAVASLLTSLAVAPVALSERAVAPVVGESEPISLRALSKVVPTGVGSCLLIGVTHGALGGMAAIYATRAGLPVSRVGLFTAAPSIGGIFLQWPLSAMSDDLDRRAVGALAAMGAMVCSALLLLGPVTSPMALLLVAIVGGFSYPLYSIASAYTNDWVEPEHLNAAASQLVTLYGIGAVIGPLLTSAVMGGIGEEGFYWTLLALHAAIAGFFVYRMRAWRSPLRKRPWSEVSLPARAFFLPATVVASQRRRRADRRRETGADATQTDGSPDRRHVG